MKPLLSIHSPKYLRRFVRVLNQHGMVDGFFPPAHSPSNDGIRCNRARVKDGQLECRQIGSNTWVRTLNPAYQYTTPNGETLCASRTT